MFKFLDQLLTSGHLDSILDDDKNEFSFDLFNLVKREIAKTGEPNKLMSSADLVRTFQTNISDREILNQCFPRTGPRTVYDPPKSLNLSMKKILGSKKCKIFTK